MSDSLLLIMCHRYCHCSTVVELAVRSKNDGKPIGRAKNRPEMWRRKRNDHSPTCLRLSGVLPHLIKVPIHAPLTTLIIFISFCIKYNINSLTGKSVLVRSRFSPTAHAIKTHRFNLTYVGIVQETPRCPTLTILPTYNIIQTMARSCRPYGCKQWHPW